MRVLEFKVSRLSPGARLGFGRSGFTRYRANHTGNTKTRQDSNCEHDTSTYLVHTSTALLMLKNTYIGSLAPWSVALIAT